MKNIKRLHRDVGGLSTVEYVILLILVAVISISAWRTFGNNVVTKVTSGSNQIQGLGP
jgi:Flp pilus assembly pilin Flp